jgi:hypothetical protein
MPILDGMQAIKLLRESQNKGEMDFSKTHFVAISAITEVQFNEHEGH